MASFDVEALAEYLQISRHETWIEKRLCLGMAAPYLVSKMPQGMVVAPGEDGFEGVAIGGLGEDGSAGMSELFGWNSDRQIDAEPVETNERTSGGDEERPS